MTSNRPWPKKKFSPLILLVGMAVFLLAGYLLTKENRKNTITIHEEFDPVAYQNSDEFKAKHSSIAPADQPSTRPVQDKTSGPELSSLPDHMASPTAEKQTQWLFDPPELKGNQGQLSQVTMCVKQVVAFNKIYCLFPQNPLMTSDGLFEDPFSAMRDFC